MKVECLHTLGEVAILRARINALNCASVCPDPFSSFEYYESLLNNDPAFRAGGMSSLWFLAAYLQDELVGYLALKRVASKILWRRSFTLDFLVGHDTDRPHVVAVAGHLSAVIEAFYRYLCGRRDWDLLELQQQAGDSPLLRYLQLNRSGGSMCSLRDGVWIKSWPTMQNHTIPLRWSSLSGYAQSLSKKQRMETKRKWRRLAELGEVRWLSSYDRHCTPALLDLYCSIEKHSWKAATDLTIGANAARRGVVRGLLSVKSSIQVGIQILLLNDLPIAGLITLSFVETPATLYALHIVFDNRYAAAAPGAAMLLLGIRHAIEARYTAFNLLSGFGYYKSRLLAEATPTQSLQVYRIGTPLFWRRLFGDLQRRLRNRKVVEKGIEVRDGILKQADDTVALSMAIEEGRRARELIEQALDGRCEFLSARDLTSAIAISFGDGGAKEVPLNIPSQTALTQSASAATC